MSITVAEMIELLKKQDPQAIILVRGYEDGYNDASIPQQKLVCARKGEWYNGLYHFYDPADCHIKWIGKPFNAILI